MELLSDVEGTSEKRRPDHDGEGGGSSSSENDDKWMRDVWSVPNRAVVMSYFCVGFAIKFLTTPTAYYAVHVLGDWKNKNKKATSAGCTACVRWFGS